MRNAAYWMVTTTLEVIVGMVVAQLYTNRIQALFNAVLRELGNW
jgi:hypothetical protein